MLDPLIDSLRAAAEPTRLRLLAICSDGELTVSDITRIVGQSQPRVSRHLKVLCSAGLLMRFREGHFVFYRVPTKGEGAALARKLLSLLPPDDEVIALDRERMERIKSDHARRAADYLRFHAEDWARLREVNVSEGQINRAIVEELNLEAVGDLLDIGTGTGRMLKLLGRHADSAVGVDISADMLQVARSNLHAAGLSNVMVRLGDMYRLRYPNGSFDTVTLDQVLYQAEDPARVIAEAARILRPGGQLLLVDFAPFAPEAGPNARLGISDDNLRTWLERAGLRCASLRHLKGRDLAVVLSVASRGARQNAAA